MQVFEGDRGGWFGFIVVVGAGGGCGSGGGGGSGSGSGIGGSAAAAATIGCGVALVAIVQEVPLERFRRNLSDVQSIVDYSSNMFYVLYVHRFFVLLPDKNKRRYSTHHLPGNRVFKRRETRFAARDLFLHNMALVSMVCSNLKETEDDGCSQHEQISHKNDLHQK